MWRPSPIFNFGKYWVYFLNKWKLYVGILFYFTYYGNTKIKLRDSKTVLFMKWKLKKSHLGKKANDVFNSDFWDI